MWADGYQVPSSCYLISLVLGATVILPVQQRYPCLIPSLPGLDLRPLKSLKNELFSTPASLEHLQHLLPQGSLGHDSDMASIFVPKVSWRLVDVTCQILSYPGLSCGSGVALLFRPVPPPASCVFMTQSCRSWWFSKYPGGCFLFHEDQLLSEPKSSSDLICGFVLSLFILHNRASTLQNSVVLLLCGCLWAAVWFGQSVSGSTTLVQT